MSGGILESAGALPWVGIFAVGSVVASLLLWILAIRSREPELAVRPMSGSLRPLDAVSVAMVAAETGRFSPLLREARLRLNAWSVRTTGFTLHRLPGRLSRRARSSAVKEARQYRRRLRRLELRAAWLEARWVPRWESGRGPGVSARSMRQATAKLLGELDGRWHGGTERT